MTWANLGFLYLKLDDIELANQCFLKAQIIDPDYARAWLGQGLIAERNGEPDHARALFAHAVTLSAGSLVGFIYMRPLLENRSRADVSVSSKRILPWRRPSSNASSDPALLI